MELDFTVSFVPVFWGLVALLLVLCGALLASIDPDITEPSSRKLNVYLGSIAVTLVAVAALVTAGVRIAHAFGH